MGDLAARNKDVEPLTGPVEVFRERSLLLLDNRLMISSNNGLLAYAYKTCWHTCTALTFNLPRCGQWPRGREQR